MQLKCDQYWPNKGLLAIYGRIEVSLVCQDVQESYTLRVLRLKCLRLETDKLVDDDDCPERDVLHFHYIYYLRFLFLIAVKVRSVLAQ